MSPCAPRATVPRDLVQDPGAQRQLERAQLCDGGVPLGPPGPTGPPVGGAPTATLVAVTVLEVSVPNTATWAPTVTLPKEGEVTSWSRYVVELPTFTVTVVPSWVVRVNVPVPTDLTVPTAAGGVPSKGGRFVWEPEAEGLGVDGVVVAAPAMALPPMAKPSAMAAALVTRTPLRRFWLTPGNGSDAARDIMASGS